MFVSYFKLKDQPFTENPPIEWILTDERFQQALSRLNFFQQQGCIALIVGQTGIGKSTLMRLFKHGLPQNRTQSIYLHLTPVTPSSFLRTVVTQLGESPKFGKDRLFSQIVERVQKNEHDTFLIIDEAHLVHIESLTDLRLLVSDGINGNAALKIILSAQESIRDSLKRTSLGDLVNRINIRIFLKTLTKTQTITYIDHRLRCADGSDKIFDLDAKELVFDYSGGVPRQINNICATSMINAASKNLKTIDGDLINETMKEFTLP